MRVLREFDPWNSELCTCPKKYSLSPYTGCSHKCVYCYITSYIPRAFECRIKNNLIKNLSLDLKKADKNLAISISNSSDPYTPIDRKYKQTREVLKILQLNENKYQIVTKSDLIIRDIDILKKSNVAVSMTITSLNNIISKKLEPNAPFPEERLKALKKLLENNIFCIVRIDPIIPSINENVEPLIKILSEIGIKDITSSTYKARYDSLKRIENAFPDNRIGDYYKKFEKFGNSIYLEKKFRFDLMKKIKELTEKYGLNFATCREGFPKLKSAKSCDGTHLILSKG